MCVKLTQIGKMLELVAKSLTHDKPIDSIHVGKAVFVKESYTTLIIEPRTYSKRGVQQLL